MAKPIKVLIVDDSLTIRAMMDSIINAESNMSVSAIVSSAEEAMGLLDEKTVNMILLDINMPGMDGLSFLDHVMKALPLPVIILSSQVSKGSEVVDDALARGAAACFDKANVTRNAKELVDMINKVHLHREQYIQPPEMRDSA